MLDRLDQYVQDTTDAANRAAQQGYTWGIQTAQQEAIVQAQSNAAMDAEIAAVAASRGLVWDGYRWVPAQ